MSKLEAALALAPDFKIFPVAPGTKNQPMLAGWPQLATSDERVIALQWGPSGTPEANIGIHCEGYVVIDVDLKKGGDRAFRLLQLNEDLPATRSTITASGGRHVFYRLPEGHPGCPNGVDVLGPGLDIRSTAGYVVAPGSVVDGRAYSFEDATAEIARAPDWLLQRLGKRDPFAASSHHDVGRVPDAPDESVERARQWLQTAERSVKGQGGDQAAFRVACKLRDLGMSYLQACELMRDEAWDHGCGWREGRLEEKPIRSAYTYAQNDGAGGRGVVEDDLPLPSAMPDSPPIRKLEGKKRGKLVRADEYANEEGRGPGYVVKNLFNRASYVVVFGQPGAGKSFLLDDIGYHVANNKPWMGMLVRGGPVLSLIFEGYGGKKKRMRALQKKYGDNLGPLYLVNATMNLREQTGRQELGAIMAEMPEKPALIIIDTFARALMGGDENSAQDVGALNDAIAKLIDNTGACVILVHHSGKNKSAGARGSSAVLGAIDTECEIDFGMLKPSKQRDLEILPPIPFKLRPVVVGIDEDGDEEKSCVVEACKAGPMRQDLKGDYQLAFMALGQLCGDSNEPVSVFDWKRKLTAEGILPEASRAQQKRFYEIRTRLEKSGHVAIEDDQVKRGMK